MRCGVWSQGFVWGRSSADVVDAWDGSADGFDAWGGSADWIDARGGAGVLPMCLSGVGLGLVV